MQDQTGQRGLNASLANEIVHIIAAATGRGASRSRAFVDGDAVVCILEDGATSAERTLVEGGQAELVRQQQHALQMLCEERLTECVERLTGRTVRAFVSGSEPLNGVSVEIFLLENGIRATVG
jgi:uncharacterized protein YbcI